MTSEMNNVEGPSKDVPEVHLRRKSEHRKWRNSDTIKELEEWVAHPKDDGTLLLRLRCLSVRHKALSLDQ
ncbi:hypothetical protein EVAR_102964_1 [Eumeta japonica]|uniref:Uncharacterized protein n=1 Tax=Eumeta variegata TaxID=151549 RepID=A0A4C1UPJ5_EUMVA|nr:hypothetical protein EVAR_102964_1 [Eumeta japonica]